MDDCLTIDSDFLKHRELLGPRVWLLLYIMANPSWKDYEAAEALGYNLLTINQHAQFLADHGFIEWKPAPTRRRLAKRDIPPKLRWAIWERDNFTCRHCGARKFLTIDHIVPELNGGTNDPDNLQTLCKSCNSKKSWK